MLNHLLYYIWGTPNPSPLLHPPRFTNGHDVMKDLPKLFTHLHHRLLSLDHLSLSPSSLLGIVRMHWCTRVHLRALQFTQVQLRASHPPNSCSESSEWVRLEQGFCLSSLEQVCLLLPLIPTLMAPCHHYSPSTPWPGSLRREWNFQAEVIGGKSFRCDECFSSSYSLAEHIISDRCQESFWSALNNATNNATAIGFHNILTLLWYREYVWPIFHCLFVPDDSLERRFLPDAKYSGYRVASSKGMEKQ